MEACDSAVRPCGCGPEGSSSSLQMDGTEHSLKGKGNCAISEGIFQEEVSHAGSGCRVREGFLDRTWARAAITLARPRPDRSLLGYPPSACWRAASASLREAAFPVKRFAVSADAPPLGPSLSFNLQQGFYTLSSG